MLNTAVTSRLNSIQFGIYSSEDVKNLSVVEVFRAQTQDILGNPLNNGPLDKKMGPVETSLCDTCGLTGRYCPGHLGHIHLSFPVFHPMLFDQLMRLSKSICLHCERLRLSVDRKAYFVLLLDAIDRGDLSGAQGLLENAGFKQNVKKSDKNSVSSQSESFDVYRVNINVDEYPSNETDCVNISVAEAAQALARAREAAEKASSAAAVADAMSQKITKAVKEESVSVKAEARDTSETVREMNQAAVDSKKLSDASQEALKKLSVAEQNLEQAKAAAKKIATQSEIQQIRSYFGQNPPTFIRTAIARSTKSALYLASYGTVPRTNQANAKVFLSSSLLDCKRKVVSLIYSECQARKCDNCKLFSPQLRSDRIKSRLFLLPLNSRQIEKNEKVLKRSKASHGQDDDDGADDEDDDNEQNADEDDSDLDNEGDNDDENNELDVSEMSQDSADDDSNDGNVVSKRKRKESMTAAKQKERNKPKHKKRKRATDSDDEDVDDNDDDGNADDDSDNDNEESEEGTAKKIAETGGIVTPMYLRDMVRKAFENDPTLLRLLFGKDSSPEIFFLEYLLVTPNRFRREGVSFGDTGAGVAAHPKTRTYELILQRLHALEAEFEKANAPNEQASAESSSDSDVPMGATDGETVEERRQRRHPRVDSRQQQQQQQREAVVTPLVVAKWSELQRVVNWLFSSEDTEAARISITGLKDVLEKKEGLFRSNMMGKRVNLAARSVISPDPLLAPDEIGIPLEFAMVLTYPEPVNVYNLHRLTENLKRGNEAHPGATAYKLAKKPKTMLRALRNESSKQRGTAAAELLAQSVDNANGNLGTGAGQATVWRHIKNGDMVLVNRQPTLHRPSMMAHRVRVLGAGNKERVIRMHYANCSSYNADFDGDEMNIHFPQDELARAEAQQLASASNQYVVPKDGTPLRGLIQDNIVAGVMLTQVDTLLTREQFQQLLWSGLDGLALSGSGALETMEPAVLKPVPLWTGKQVISALLAHVTRGRPPMSLVAKTRLAPRVWGPYAREAQVRVFCNELLSGVLDKAHLGATKFGLLHACHELHGPLVCANLLSAFGRLMTVFLQYAAFSCGLDDLALRPTAETELRAALDRATEAGNAAAIEQQQKEKLRGPGSTEDQQNQRIDAAVSSTLSQHTSDAIEKILNCGGLLKSFPANRFSLMTLSGAKGSQVNHSQISCLLGQQELEGRRVPIMSSGRTLPGFSDRSAGSKPGGFVTGRFMTGVAPQDYFFHSMAGREGLVDTAVKTSRSGYLQRCLIKHLESLVVAYDGSVRSTSDNSIVQFIYGEDGLDVSRTGYLYNFDFYQQNYSCLQQYEVANNRDHEQDMFPRRWGRVLKRARLRTGDGSSSSKSSNGNNTEELSASDSEHSDDDVREPSFSDPLLSKRNAGSTFGVVSEKFAEHVDGFINQQQQQQQQQQQSAASDFAQVMARKWQKSLADPGESVGLLCAQSLGEPSTQMTLNTFHLAGRGDVNVTLGIPRLRELLFGATGDLAERKGLPSTRIMTIPVRDVCLDANGAVILDNDPASLARVHTRLTAADNAPRLVAQLDRVRVVDVISQSRVEEHRHQQDSDEPATARRYTLTLTLLPEEVYRSHVSPQNVQDVLCREMPNFLSELIRKAIIRQGLGRPKKESAQFIDKDSVVFDVARKAVTIPIEIPIYSGKSKLFLHPVVQRAIEKCIIVSTPGVSRAVVSSENMMGIKGPVVQTEGINLRALFRLPLQMGADLNRIFANSPHEMLAVYGIEAARAHLVQEIDNVFKAYGITVDPRHLSLLSDHMTFSGRYLGTTRNSMGNMYFNVMDKMSFETTVDFLKKAVLGGERDPLSSASSRLAMGIPGRFGTGYFDLLLE